MCQGESVMNDIVAAERRPAQVATSQVGDRRRPGRVPFKNAKLIKLLRDPASMETSSVSDVLSTEDAAELNTVVELNNNGLRAATGIIRGLFLSLGCWIVIGSAVWFLRS